jgi:hypothetical protein
MVAENSLSASKIIFLTMQLNAAVFANKKETDDTKKPVLGLLKQLKKHLHDNFTTTNTQNLRSLRYRVLSGFML